MRVDDVPLLLQPAFHAYGYGLGALLQASNSTIRHTCRHEWGTRSAQPAAAGLPDSHRRERAAALTADNYESCRMRLTEQLG